MKEVAFEALVIENKIKSLVSMDKEARLILQYKAEDNDLIDQINRLHSAEKTIMVVLMEGKPLVNIKKK